jgi:2-oxo-4-hydroxy-4-carboxy-5-ureidoimidazoline decarboxylase
MTLRKVAELDGMTQEAFVTLLGGVFEETPAIAQRVWTQRPFASLEGLHGAMVAELRTMDEAAQMALIRAHPDLGSRARMAAASVAEQAGAGLDQLTAAEYGQFQRLNRAYGERFGFPFIVAVKNHTKASILAAFETRLQNSVAAEREQALREIMKIAWFRLVTIFGVDE